MIKREFWETARSRWIVGTATKPEAIKTGSGGKIDPTLLIDPFEAIRNQYGQEAIQPEPPKRPKLDADAFDENMGKHAIPGYLAAAELLMACMLPVEMNEQYEELTRRLPVLQEAIEKFKGVYDPDMEIFYEYYIPEALNLTADYLAYLDAGVGEQVIRDTETEVLDAVKKLILAVNDKIDEIYKFASIEIKAKAKALESLMSQDGYVDPEHKF